MKSMVRFVRLCVLVLLCSFLLIFGQYPLRAERAGRYVEGEILVGIKSANDGPAVKQRLFAFFGDVSDHLSQLGVFHVRLRPGLSVANAVSQLNRSGIVAFAEPNYIRTACAIPNDPKFSTDQYGPQKIKAPLAWESWQPSGTTILAIVDTGVSGSHPDLTNKMLRNPDNSINGYNALTGIDGPATDDNGHGTHCAGIAAAETNNATGIAGVAGWNPSLSGSGSGYIRIMPVKVLNSSGSGDDAGVADGINHAVTKGAKIISMSLGGPDTSQTLQTAVANAWNAGVLVVCAAGNTGTNALFYPASYDHVVSVAATDSSDTMAGFSTYGSWVTLAAPGVNVYSTYLNGGYATLSGTSMACPHVAGSAAFLKAQNQLATNQQISDALTSTTDPYNTIGRNPASANGRVNLAAASAAIGGHGAPPAPSGVTAGAGNTAVAVSWNTDPVASTYNVKRGTAPGGPYQTLVTSLTANTYTDTGLTNGTTYYYVVSATNANGTSPNSQEASATPNSIVAINCGGPQYNASTGRLFLADTFYTGGALLAYAARPIAGTNDPTLFYTIHYGTHFTYNLPAVNGAYNVTFYFAEVNNAPVGWRSFNVKVNGVVVIANLDVVQAAGGVNAAVIRTFPVTVSNGVLPIAIDSNNANNAIIQGIELIPTSSSPPAPPTNLNATSGAQINLTWTASAGATSYNLYRGTSSGGEGATAYKTNITQSPYSDTGGAAGTTYFYKVTAMGPGGESGMSNEASATLAPAAPMGLGAQPGTTSVSLNWSASSGATSYTVKRGTVSGSYDTTVPNINGTSYVDNSVTGGTKYYYVVSATNAGGESGNSSEVSATPGAPSSAPTLTASRGVGMVALSWTSVAGAASYNIYRGTSPGGEGTTPYTQGVSGTTFNDLAANNGTTYYYKVSGVNNVGEGPLSNEASAIPEAAIRVNCGGPQYTAVDGRVFSADNYFLSGQILTYPDRPIANSVDDPLFFTIRYNPNFAYSFPARTNAKYTLNLYFAEVNTGIWVGYRKFNVSVNGSVKISNFETLVAAGGFNIAIVKTLAVTGANNAVKLNLDTVTGANSVIQAIELIPTP